MHNGGWNCGESVTLFASTFLQLYLAFFDGVFCIFSTKEVTRSGMILPNSITLFLFLFSVLLFAVVSGLTYTRVPAKYDGAKLCLMAFLKLYLLFFDGVFCIFSTTEVT